MWSLVNSLMSYLGEHWREPDEGLWEVRGHRRHFVHSKVMAWVAADRALRMARMLGVNGSVGRWREMRREVRREGWDDEQKSFVQSYGSQALDASLLLIPKLGFLPAHDGRVRSTVEAIRSLDDHGFLRRYAYIRRGVHGVDGLHGPEGAFVACSLWFADALAATGRPQEACEIFERVLDIRNDVGLLSEQWDPERHRQLGNAPQAFSHIALVDTAFTLRKVLASAGGVSGSARSCGRGRRPPSSDGFHQHHALTQQLAGQTGELPAPHSTASIRLAGVELAVVLGEVRLDRPGVPVHVPVAGSVAEAPGRVAHTDLTASSGTGTARRGRSACRSAAPRPRRCSARSPGYGIRHGDGARRDRPPA